MVPGISINRVGKGRLDEGWIVADYRDIADLVRPAALPRDAWAGEPLAIAPAPPSHAKSRLAMYRWLVEQSYERRRPQALAEAMHPEYVGFDPFRDRGTGLAGAIAFHEKVIAMYRDLRYHVLDAVESDDRLAVRYRVEGIDSTGRRPAGRTRPTRARRRALRRDLAPDPTALLPPLGSALPRRVRRDTLVRGGLQPRQRAPRHV